MKLAWFATAALATTANATFGEHDALAAQGLINLGIHVATKGYPNPKTCTLKNVRVRREWSLLTRSEKLSYIDAVKCLASKPARTPAAIAAGARSRYDDFVVTHILQTMTIHGTANFLAWHRYYLLAYEDTLRNECGYKGYHRITIGPGGQVIQKLLHFWTEATPVSQVMVHSSRTEMQAASRPSNGAREQFPRQMVADVWKVNLGPVQSLSKEVTPNPQSDGLGYNPRCIRRDINPVAAAQTTDAHIVDLLTNYRNISAFQDRMQSAGPFLGVHLGGHYTIGGDAGSDFFNSPSDPTFFLHHAMIDRVWWIWQNLDLETRGRAVAGTITFLNMPPSRNGTFDDILSMGYVGVKDITIGDTMSTLGGPFCYVYA